MNRIALLLLAIMCVSCAPDEPDMGNPYEISAACRRSFGSVIEEWEVLFGHVPRECAKLDAQYDIQLVSLAEMPCEEGLGDNETRGGCFLGGVVYLLEGRDNRALVDSAVHEWIHALAQCVDQDVDRFHVRAELWADYGDDTIEILAQASAEGGTCL